MADVSRIQELLGDDADSLLGFSTPKISKDQLHVPGPDWVDRIFKDTDRSIPVLRSLQQMYDTGRLGGTGYLSILPVDQGIEHSAGASFAKNPIYFDPEEHLSNSPSKAAATPSPRRSACSGSVARSYAHKIPFILKINHNELLTYPNTYEQIMFSRRSRTCFNMGCRGRSARRSTLVPTDSGRQIVKR